MSKRTRPLSAEFYTADELDQAIAALQAFCEKRAESVLGQLAGAIPSTEDGQTADSSALIDASNLNLNDMGEFNQGGGRGGQTPPNGMTPPDGFTPPNGMTPPGSDSNASASSDGSADAQNDIPTLPNGMTPPDGMVPPGSTSEEGTSQSDSDAVTGGESTGDTSAVPQSAESAAQTDLKAEGGDETDSESQLEEARRSERATNPSQPDPSAPNDESSTDSAQPDQIAPNDESPTDSAQPDPSARDNEAAFSFSRPDQGSPNGESTSDSQTWLLLAVSVFALLVGLIFAKKYRVNR